MTHRYTIVLQARDAWWRFRDPVQVVAAATPAEVLPALQTIETAVASRRLYAAGYLAYEAGAAFGLTTHPARADDPPLLWFGLYAAPEPIPPPPAPDTVQPISGWRPSVSETAYHAAIDQIKAAIADGYTYQVNYTLHLHAPFAGDPWRLFCHLSQAQQAAYTAYVDLGRHVICSASPELFYAKEGRRLLTRPMKGTASRGRTLTEDDANADWLHHSEKNRAENVMIVDMIRNDIGRIADVGSVNVPRLFEVERYPTLLQMTSTVTAESDASLSQIMAAMFPCASITGAPKVRTMEIITGLETGPRGVYTGAIGYLAPDGEAQFNVAIRTAVVDRTEGQLTYGVGSGITWDSDAAAEYEECRLKTRVLTTRRPPFQLLESLLWTPEAGCFLLDAHLARLAASATYFGFQLHETAVRARLQQLTGTLTAPAKLRLLLDAAGAITVEAAPLAGAAPEPLRVGLAKTAVDPDTVWLYHKTTRRDPYTAARAGRPDCDEVLLWNRRGELTEATTANVVLQLDGALLTPPVSAGLLPGTFRAHLLRRGTLREQTLTCADLARADAIWLINSVRKWRRATLLPHPDTADAL